MNPWDDFDCTLANALSDLPPSQETIRDVTPWRTAIDRIVLGLCLTCFSLNFLYLQYLLPAVGVIQTYLGFRTLRNANRWFRLAWYASICKAVSLYANLILAATPWEPASALLKTVLSIACMLLLLLGLRQGLRQIARPFGARRDPVLWALVWYLVLMALALLRPEPGWPTFILLIAAFVLIIRSLCKVRDQLETCGYTMEAAPVRLSAERVLAAYLGSLALAVLLAAVLSCRAPLAGAPVEQNFDSHETAAIRQELTDLHLPEAVVNALPPEDLARLSGAVESTEAVGGLPLGNVGEDEHQNQVFALLFPDGSVQLLHVFSAEPDGTIWQNKLSLRCDASLSEVTGRLFYTHGGSAMTAPLAFEEPDDISGIDFFGETYQQFRAESALFSWPAASQDRWGYVIARVDQAANPKTTFSEILTVSSASMPRYPYQQPTGKEWRYGRQFYYGNGASLLWKADEERS
ncbi:hypothetical protein [uncultured Dysosmobacter sp.]|uniref:hypothetical protein n=1 Tax=uncultured Dysosmobacter sp. TaxID=2591384 RepID=UPI0026129F0C|nr:hypothetical protein [uncultured Dysosmobacter sp.]